MKVEGVFEAALLRYIRTHLDPDASEVTDVTTYRGTCHCDKDDWTCLCNTDLNINVFYRVRSEDGINVERAWTYGGRLLGLIRMLDKMEEEAT